MSGTSTAPTIVVDASLAIWTVLPVPAQTDVLDLLADWHRRKLRLATPMLWLAECVSAARGAVSTVP